MPICTKCGGLVSLHEEKCPGCGEHNTDYQPLAEDIQRALDEATSNYQQKKYVLAAQAYQEVIALDPEIFSAYFFLADSLQNLGKTGDAKQAMQAAAALRPGSAPVYYNLGYMNECLGDFTGARAAYEQALKLAENDVNVQNNKDFIKRIKKQLKAVKKHG
ncbi:MAG: tetratricopeptide repeat protein [Anaerolineaceae bacterium]|nr:tetratricopeptide repeat protein [Anaerolineaceae bacterium]MBN2678038.1 tetratricopeptide repeat protein [Anaerolineaceae bacterium]